jgi:sugar phosphate isomerase/epimerase/type 1 glutamine amidotransferase
MRTRRHRFSRAAVMTAAVLLNAAAAFSQNPMPSLLGWKAGVLASSFRNATLFEALDLAAPMGVKFIEGYAEQRVSADIPKNLNWDLTDAELTAVRQKMQSRGIGMPVYYTRNIPADPENAARLARFLKALGVDTIVAEPEPASLAALDKLANEFGFNLAIHNHTRQSSPVYWEPKNVMAALDGRSKRMGVCADIGAWMREGIKPVEGLRIVKDRLLSVHLHDPNDFGAKGQDAVLGNGKAGIVEFVREIHNLGLKPVMLTVEYSPRTPNAVNEIAQSHVFLLSKTIAPIVGKMMDETSKKTPIRRNVSAEERELITKAAPKTAPAKAKKPRKLLVVDLQAAYGGHRSIPHANLAVELMAKNTGAFEAIFDNDLANLRYDKLRQFDALYLNNTVGPILNAPDLREGLLRYVREGGGLAGNHGTSRTSLDWPEFAELLGAHSGPHGDGNEKAAVKLDDPHSPINAAFGGKPFEFTDEYFRFPNPPYSREKLRILLSFDTARMDMKQGRICSNCARADNDYPISWIRSYGKGRVFFSSFGNAPAVFWSAPILEHFLAGFQFVLGDLEADTTPSAKLAAHKATGR